MHVVHEICVLKMHTAYSCMRTCTFHKIYIKVSLCADFKSALSEQENLGYSQVPNKRGGGENNQGGWKWFDITIIGGWNNQGGLLEETETSRFLR